VIYLDASAEVLFARKQEESLETLDRMRTEYRTMVERLPQAVLVDASGDAEQVALAVAAVIRDRGAGNEPVPARESR
jgi:hypothetical protein